jgi:hypothetical protein
MSEKVSLVTISGTDFVALSCVRQVVQKRFAMASVMFLCSAEAGRFFIPT